MTPEELAHEIGTDALRRVDRLIEDPQQRWDCRVALRDLIDASLDPLGATIADAVDAIAEEVADFDPTDNSDPGDEA